MYTKYPIDAMWDVFPIDVTTEANFVWSIKNSSICAAFRTCIHNRCTPSGRSFSHHTASISLAIHQYGCGRERFPCLTRKFLAPPVPRPSGILRL